MEAAYYSEPCLFAAGIIGMLIGFILGGIVAIARRAKR
jgi:hypothetical protein